MGVASLSGNASGQSWLYGIRWFQSPAWKLSAHRVVDLDGRITQPLPFNRAAAAEGRDGIPHARASFATRAQSAFVCAHVLLGCNDRAPTQRQPR
jgi:hypothetical protein